MVTNEFRTVALAELEAMQKEKDNTADKAESMEEELYKLRERRDELYEDIRSLARIIRARYDHGTWTLIEEDEED